MFYSGQDTSFTLSDKIVCMKGLLPPISVSASEVKQEICNVFSSDTDLSSFGIDDFQFISVNGKNASVAYFKEGFEWSGRAVKELAGSGSVYVCLTKTLSETDSFKSATISSQQKDKGEEFHCPLLGRFKLKTKMTMIYIIYILTKVRIYNIILVIKSMKQ